MQVVELPCSVCENQSMQNVLGTWLKGEGIKGGLEKYILERLPGTMEEMHGMRKKLHGRTWMHPDVCTGRDEMRATAVAKRFLETAEVLENNAWQQWLKGTSDNHLCLPNVTCLKCGRLLGEIGSRKGGPIPTQCAAGVGCRK